MLGIHYEQNVSLIHHKQRRSQSWDRQECDSIGLTHSLGDTWRGGQCTYYRTIICACLTLHFITATLFPIDVPFTVLRNAKGVVSQMVQRSEEARHNHLTVRILGSHSVYLGAVRRQAYQDNQDF
jgi:hypothetical protein